MHEKNKAKDQEQKAKLAAESEAKQRVVAENATTDAAQQRDEAKQQTAIAEAVARFQSDMLTAADPSNLMGDKVTVVQAMEAATKAIDNGSLKDQPLVEAQVRNVIGMTFVGLARYSDAEPNLRKSLAICEKILPAGHPYIAKAKTGLAVLLKAQNKMSDAESLMRQALAIDRASLPAGDPETIQSINNLGLLLMDQHTLAEAEPLLREGLEISRANHADLANSLNSLGTLLWEGEKTDRGGAPVPRGIGDRPREPPRRASAYRRLPGQPVENPVWSGQVHRSRTADARSAGDPPGGLSKGHPDIAEGLNNLVTLLDAQNKRAEAEPLAREAVEILRKALTPNDPDLAFALYNLEWVMQARNAWAEGEPLIREVVKIDRVNYPAGDPRIAVDLSELGLNLKNQNKLDDAEPVFREALQTTRKGLPAKDPDIAKCLNNLGGLLEAQGKFDEAEPLIREAIEIDRAAFPRRQRRPWEGLELSRRADDGRE